MWQNQADLLPCELLLPIRLALEAAKLRPGAQLAKPSSPLRPPTNHSGSARCLPPCCAAGGDSSGCAAPASLPAATGGCVSADALELSSAAQASAAA